MKSTPQLLAVILIFLTTTMGRGASYTNNLVIGQNLIANQLNGTNNNINTVLPDRTDGDVLVKWNAGSQSFFPADTYYDLGDPSVNGWYDGSLNLSTTTLHPGEGAFYQSQVATNIIFSGTQGVPNLPRPYHANYAIVSRQIPGSGTFENIMGFAPVNEAQFNRFNPATQLMETNSFNGSVWTGGVPAANVGEGVFVFLPTLAPVVITQQPVNQTTNEGQSVTFTVGASGAPPLAYQWHSNSIVVPGATNPAYTFQPLRFANSAQYYAIVANPSSSATSSVATLTVINDESPPTLLNTVGASSRTTVSLIFSEPLAVLGATNGSNYSITNSAGASLSLSAAVLSADGKNVTLTTVAQTPNVHYFVVVNNVTDRAGVPNVIAPNPSVGAFTASELNSVAGMVLFRAYPTGGGTTIPLLTGHPSFPNSPDFTALIGGMNSRLAGGVYANNSRDGYGGTIVGHFIPPTSGNWIFYISSDDDGQLIMNTNGPSAAGAVPVRVAPACCRPLVNGDDPTAPFSLLAGQAYYMEGRYKEGGGGDYLEVGARMVGDNSAIVPIGSTNLAFYYQLRITQNPANVTRQEGQIATFNAVATVDGALTGGQRFQWQRSTDTTGSSFTNIPGGTNNSFSVPVVLADDQFQFRVEVRLLTLQTNLSTAAILTVVADTDGPTLVRLNIDNGFQTIYLTYSEPVAPGMAGEASKYILYDPAATFKPQVGSVQYFGSNVVLHLVDPDNSQPMSMLPNAVYTLELDAQQDLAAIPNSSVPSPILADFPTSFFYTNNVVAGFSLIANQLSGTNNLLDTVISGAQDGDQIIKWNHALQQASEPDTYAAGVGWVDGSLNPSTTTLNPGEGAFYYSSAPHAITHAGTQGVVNLPLPYLPGYNLVSRQIPSAGTFQNIMGFAPVSGCQFIRFDRASQTYSTNFFNGTTWSGGAPSANVGEAVFVFLPPIPPTITRQPMSQSTTDGQPVTFTVTAVGPGPLSYQWYRNGVDIPGANLDRYTIPAAPLADNGAGFSVVIGNTSGSVTSTVATLTVGADVTPPTVRKVTNTPDFMQIRIAFSERVNGSDANDPSNYSIPGLSIISAVLSPDGSNVTLTVTLTEGANYTLSIANIHDLSSSANTLQPNPTSVMFQAAVPPIITEQPQDRVVNPGDPTTLVVTASGTAPLAYQWYKNNRVLSNEMTSGISFPAVQPQHVGSYHVVVANSAGSVTSIVVRLGFLESYTLDLPAGYSTIARQLFAKPPPFPAVPNGTQLFVWRAAVGQFEVFTYDSSWSPADPVLSPGEGAIIFLTAPAMLTFSGLRIPAMLPTNAPTMLSLISAPVPVNARFTDIIGAPPQEGQIVYRLRPNATNAMLLTTENYRLSYFRHGTWHDSPPVAAVGESVWVGFAAPVVITSQPVGITNAAIGQGVTFSVNATGGAPLHYQWLLNGTPVPGATNSMHSIASVSPIHAGLYTVSVGNVLGDIFSEGAYLTLDVPGFNMTDSFSAQEILTNASRLLSSQNRNATRELGEPFHGGRKANRSVWLTWEPQVNGIVTMSTVGSGFDTILAAYTGLNVSNLTLIDASDDDADFGWSRIKFNVVAGTSYRICVAGLGDERGDILLDWNLEVTSAVLPVILAQPQDQSAGYGATIEFSVVAANGALSYQWFRNGAPLPDATTAVLTILNAGFNDVGFYFVRVSNLNRFRESEVVSLQLESPQPGEPFTGGRATGKLLDIGGPESGGQPLKGPGPDKLIVGTVNRGYSGNTTVGCAYGRDANEPYPCSVSGSNTIWYAVRSETNGTMYVRTDGSTFNTVIAAYTGPGNNYITLTNVGCDNDSGLDGFDSRMSFPVTANRTNYIQVQGVGNVSGTVVLNYWVVRPLSITNLFYTNGFGGRFTMTVNSTSNLLTSVQYSTNLSATNWVTLTNYTPNFTGVFNVTNNAVGPSSNRFYRAVHTF